MSQYRWPGNEEMGKRQRRTCAILRLLQLLHDSQIAQVGTRSRNQVRVNHRVFGCWRELSVTKSAGDEIGNRETGRTLARVYLAVRPGCGIDLLCAND